MKRLTVGARPCPESGLEYEFRTRTYAVWTQSRQVDGSDSSLPLTSNLGTAFTAGSMNVLMLKLSDRWGV